MGTPRAAPLLLLLLLPAAWAAPRDGGHRSEVPPATRPDPGPDPLSPEPPALQLLRSAVRSLGQPEQDAEDMTREQALLYLFALHDHDRSGLLDGLELLQLLGAVLAQGGRGQPSPEAVAVLVDRALERQDRSGDGLLDPPELLLPGWERGPPGEPLVGEEVGQEGMVGGHMEGPGGRVETPTVDEEMPGVDAGTSSPEPGPAERQELPDNAAHPEGQGDPGAGAAQGEVMEVEAAPQGEVMEAAPENEVPKDEVPRAEAAPAWEDPGEM
ncbi:cell growth regulator with EF hand domain protein 1 [Oxyura jamaicensis]|uniref:cell growth regulator with EF hand domain protein 1 n=1 Tax=Oxyura jamaicensis TaxID=8884 RepID=UPI0015A57025|nr:cell growth regulator with EF hand domain protein 1 [Oxyura jamaicensis]XP_035177404.1 cell growth regulator with EF hand domain protein 1 [Oxyura jamaicensis]